MNICIDMRPALSRPTGVGNYLQNLVTALAQIDTENQYHLFSSSWKERYPAVFYGSNFKVHDHRWPVRILNYGWNHLSFPRIEYFLKTSLDVAHSPTPLVMPTRDARTVTTIYDLYFYKHPAGTVREMQTDYPDLLRKHCMRSDAIIAISDYTKSQIVELLGVPSSRIYTIRLGIDPFYFTRAPSSQTSEVLARLNIPGPYILFVGTREPRKNISVLLDAYRNLNEQVLLVLAGHSGWGMELTEFPEGVIVTDYLSKNDLRVLYQKASAVVFPSLEEGFGLPLVEAMASGVPVIASRIPASQEVCNDSCTYFDPENAEELTEQIRAVLGDRELCETLIAKGKERIKKFSWKDTAQKTLDLYMSL
jgi:glycosyltransferase involved in cell wall biosynthesis